MKVSYTLGVGLGLLLLAACNRKESSSTSDKAEPAASVHAATIDTDRVLVTDDGFQPSRVVLHGKHSLTFRRTTNETCATKVVFPNLGIEKDLPLNTDVTVELPPSAKGELAFQCGMGMYKSAVVVD